jgi:hypothetical protein
LQYPYGVFSWKYIEGWKGTATVSILFGCESYRGKINPGVVLVTTWSKKSKRRCRHRLIPLWAQTKHILNRWDKHPAIHYLRFLEKLHNRATLNVSCNLQQYPDFYRIVLYSTTYVHKGVSPHTLHGSHICSAVRSAK